MAQRAQSKAIRITNFKEKRRPSEPLFTETKILNLTNIITLIDWMLVFYHLSSSLPPIFDDLFKPVKEQLSQNTRGVRRYVLNISKMKTSFYGSRSVQEVKSIKDWNNIANWQSTLYHWRFYETLWSYQIYKKCSSAIKLPLLLTNLDNFLFTNTFLFLSKMQPLPILLNNNNTFPFLFLWFLFVSLFGCHI